MSGSSENSETQNGSEVQGKLAQQRLERIRKEEEEEQWISGEELYTEGSSDEDDAALRAKRRGKVARKNRRATPSRQKQEPPKIQAEASSDTPTASKSSNHVDNPEAEVNTLTSKPKLENLSLSDEGMASTDKAQPSTSSGLQAESEQAEISWRPKRGSIKLPNINPEDDNGEIVTEIFKTHDWAFSDISEDVIEPQGCISSGFPDSADEIFKTDDALCIYYANDSYAQTDQTRPQNKKSCGETSNLQSAFMEMNKYDNLLECMTKKEREARELTSQLQLQIKNKLLELNGSQHLNGQLAKNIRSFVQLCAEEIKNQDNEEVVLPNLNANANKNTAIAPSFVNHCYTSEQQKPIPKLEQRPKTAGDVMKKKMTADQRVQSAVTTKKEDINFIERNIKSISAKTEALTDEEKQQLSVILKDFESMKEEFIYCGEAIIENCFLLENLNVQNVESSVTDLLTSQSKEGESEILNTRNIDLGEHIDAERAFPIFTSEQSEKLKHLLEEKESDAKYKYPSSQQKLMDIDNALSLLQTSSQEEVNPISEEEIRHLIKDYFEETTQSLHKSEITGLVLKDSEMVVPMESDPQNLSVDQQSSEKCSLLDAETLNQLLDDTYKNLPNFKYRYKV